ncbi:MAG: hypothetical protein ACOC2H_09380 [Spirochaetota bacterium]
MISTHRSNDCGNSPKNSHVEELTLSLLAKEFDDFKEIKDSETAFIVQFEDKLNIVSNLDEYKKTMPDRIEKIDFKHSISHGKVGASWGSFKANKHTYMFSVNIEFNNVKLSKPTVIQILISAPI